MPRPAREEDVNPSEPPLCLRIRHFRECEWHGEKTKMIDHNGFAAVTARLLRWRTLQIDCAGLIIIHRRRVARGRVAGI